MIGSVSGLVGYRAADHVLIDAGGVGYLVYCSERTLSDLPAEGERATLYTDLLVREDILALYGFRTVAERELHRLLVGVQGVGAKASLSVLGELGWEGAVQAISLRDWQAVKAAHGVGPKIAQRIVNELADKIEGLLALAPESGADASRETTSESPAARPSSSPKASSVRAEAFSALVNLGCGHAEATRLVAEALGENPDFGTAEVIQSALRRMAPAG